MCFAGAGLAQWIDRQSVGQRATVTAQVQAQAPARLWLARVLASEGAQDDRTGITVAQLLDDVAGVGLPGVTQRLAEPFG